METNPGLIPRNEIVLIAPSASLRLGGVSSFFQGAANSTERCQSDQRRAN